MENKYAPIGDYDYQMIEAYIDKPEVTDWYVNAFKKFSINGVEVMRWHWSWWAFFGNIFYLLYRKAYIAAGVFFLLFFVASLMGPLGWLILLVLTGGYGPYAVYLIYKEKRLKVEEQVESEDKRFETMRFLGSYNDWAIWVGAIVHFFMWVGSFLLWSFILTLFGIVAGCIQ